MAVSPITGITQEGQPEGLSSFLRAGVMHVVWSDVAGLVSANRRLKWKPHTSADYTETITELVHVFKNVNVLYYPSTDQLVAVWDDGTSSPNQTNGNVYMARFAYSTGAAVSGPTLLGEGSDPKLCFRGASTTSILLYYRAAKTGGVYGRLSLDGGLTWQSAEPLITGQVAASTAIEVTSYDDSYVSVAQVGGDTRAIREVSLFARTRPLSSIVAHPTVANQFFIAEPSKGADNVTLIDNLRGALKLSTDHTKLFHLDGIRQGTSDTIGAVALVSVTGTVIAPVASAGPVASPVGHDLVAYTLTPALSTPAVVLPGATSFAVDFDVSATHAYVAEYSDSTTNGQFVVVRLSDSTTATILSAITGVRAISVANFLGIPLIFVATTESGIERLRVYQQNDLTPTLLLNIKLPARVVSLAVSAGTAPATVRILVSMVDRFGIYDYYSAITPLRCVDTFQFSGGGQFFRAITSASGNIFVAAGAAGVVVFNRNGRVLAQLRVSGEVAPAWRPATAYTASMLVRPTSMHQFFPNRYYFRCSSSGTSGNGEPSWDTSGTMTDGTAQWQPVGVMDGVVTDVALDVAAKRIYAVGSAGGNLGTDGRVWVLNVGGLL